MLETLVHPQRGYQAEKRYLQDTEQSVFIRQVRGLARRASFYRATHAPSRHYRPGKVWRGLEAVFVDKDDTRPLPGVRSRAKGSGPAEHSEADWACLLGENRKEEDQRAEAERSSTGLTGKGDLRGAMGIPAAARREIEHSLWTLSGFKRRLAFWTITLPTPALVAMKEVKDGWAKFSARVHKELTRRLDERLVCSSWLSVTELQERRTSREGIPCPHLHVCFVNRRGSCRRGPGRHLGPWVLGPAELDGIIRVALLSSVGRADWNLSAAGNVKRVKKDAGRYLAKYMSKGGKLIEYWNQPEVAGGLRIPRWWHRSKPMKNRAEAHRPVLHGNIGWYALGHAFELEALGIAKVTQFEPDEFRPGGVKVRALRRDGIQLVVEMFLELDPFDEGGISPYVPRFLRREEDWEDWDYRYGPASLSRGVAVKRARDVVAVPPGPVPSGYSDANHGFIEMGERISGPVTDIVKERLEHLYREIEVPEPVFSSAGGLGREGQLKLPVDLGGIGSAWDVGGGDSWDPYWDTPGRKGGPPV
jgi:hypothetical protein